jgi:Tfp pilus assembly protein PilP
MNSIRVITLLTLFVAVVGCEKKKDAVLTPQQEEEYARMMRNAPKPTYDQLQEENTRLKREAEEKATNP